MNELMVGWQLLHGPLYLLDQWCVLGYPREVELRIIQPTDRRRQILKEIRSLNGIHTGRFVDCLCHATFIPQTKRIIQLSVYMQDSLCRVYNLGMLKTPTRQSAICPTMNAKRP